MNVTVEYAAQVKKAAGIASECVDVAPASTVQDLLLKIANSRGEVLKKILFDSNGALHPSILLFVGDDQVRWESTVELKDRDVITILSPISGG